MGTSMKVLVHRYLQIPYCLARPFTQCQGSTLPNLVLASNMAIMGEVIVLDTLGDIAAHMKKEIEDTLVDIHIKNQDVGCQLIKLDTKL